MELEGDATDGAALDAFHEMGGKPGYFVAEAFRWDDCLFLDGWMGEWVNGMEGRKAKTHDFIDDSLVSVEIKGKAGVAVVQVTISLLYVFVLLNDTHYFSIKTREALLVVLVRTRPYIRSFSL